MIGFVGRREDPEEFDNLDIRAFRFPSDVISIRHLRAAFPEHFDRGFGDRQETQPLFFFQLVEEINSKLAVGEMLQCERAIAVAAYADARGLKAPHICMLVEDQKTQLADLYIQFGLAKGLHHAGELIRDIERQGEELGRSKQQ